MEKTIRYLPALMLFGAITAIYTICCTPDLTWVNIDCDGIYYYNKAVYLIDWSGNPVYAGLGWLASKIPIGSVPWRVAFFCSALPAVIAAALVFIAVRKQTVNKWAPYVGAAAFAASPIVISQATVHEIYILAAAFVAGAYCAVVYKKFWLAILLLGLAFCTNWATATPAVIAFLLWKPQLLKRVWLLLPFLLAPFLCAKIWSDYEILNYWSFLPSVLFHGEVSGVPFRFVQTLGILVIALGAAWLPAFLFLKDWKKALLFFAIFIPPIVHLLTCPCIEGYVQLCVAAPFLAIAAGLGVDKLRTKILAPVVLTVSCLTLLVAPAFWDIGRTLDPSPTTARVLLQQVSEVPDGSVILCSRQLDGVEDSVGMLNRGAVEMLNRELDKNLLYVNPSMYVSATDYYGERARLESLGLNTPYVPAVLDQTGWDCQNANMVALAEANGNIGVYLTVITEQETFGCELVKLN